jgi:pimeloyl-ACP methyl ester carboxylesterase
MDHPTTPDDRTPIRYDAAGSGPVLLLVHAFPLDRTMWRPQVAAMSDRYRVIAPDVFGFGESGLPAGGWSMDSMAAGVAKVLDGLGISAPVVLGGLSMGGYVAMAFARRYPGRLRGLILADTRAEPDSPEGKANRDKTIALAREQGPAAVFEQMLPKMLTERTRTERPALVAKAKQIAASQSADSVTAALAALRDRPDATSGLRSVRVPTLVLVGEEDAVTPPEAARTIAGLAPGARLETIPSAAHLSNMEAPDEFTRHVRSFLDSLP